MWIISKFNFRALYIFSDILHFLIYNVVGYRRKTIYNNLNMVFPEKSKKEINEIYRQSTKNITDSFFEFFKSLNISEDEMKSRFKFKNIEVINEIENNNQSAIVLCGHFSGFEWMFIIDRFIKSNFYAVYKRLRNKHFDKLVKKIRGRYNGHLIHTKETRERIAKNVELGTLDLYAFASDQTPRLQKSHHWNYFMNIWVPIHTGAEMIAKQHNLALVFMKIKRIKRGYYETSFEKITTTPRDYKDYELTDKYMKLVEKEIYSKPDLYLWSHRRWKHRDKTPQPK